MRRQARKSVSGALIVRSASALQVWLWLLLFVFQNEFRISWSIKPGYLDYDNLPETNFTCTGKVIGGYYADLETSCQMFHVCTIGQQNEPMDIKFLCLNGTVFDQETRVCERVDEVDCTKSEKFYSLNLELYGSTVPPIVPPEPEKPQTPDTELAQKTNNTNTHILNEYVNENPTTPDKAQNQQSDTIDSTEDPIQDYKKEEPKTTTKQHLLPSKDEGGISEEYEDDEEAIDNENTGYDDDYSQPFTTTTIQIITSTTTTTKKPTTSITTTKPPSSNLPYLPPLITTPSPLPPSFAPSISPSSTIDPSLLSPQEFIYRHRGPGSEAISFQRQSFRPADGVYITHAPSQQFDHFQYESSRTAPRPVVSHPSPFQRPSPSPFRATTIDPSDQLLRPVANSQSSERHETTIKHRPQNFPAHLPAQPPLPFNPFYYDRKRSDDILPDDKSSLSARSVAPPPRETERSPIKLKSPPRVIVTASASVSDSNGKRLNYTVGNVVSAVKPIVPINYDDYKESDLIFDPFFLDVPKLHPRRKARSSNSRKIVSVPALTAKPLSFKPEKIVTTLPPQTSQATTAKASSFTQSSTTVGWNPHDYVDDNYEPHSYNMQPVPPLAVLLNRDYTQSRKPDKPVKNVANKELKSSHIIKQLKSTTLEAQKSSQNVGTEAVLVTSPTPYGTRTCVTSHSTDCQTRA